MIHNIRTITTSARLVVCALALALGHAACQPVFHVISSLNGYQQPGGIIEGSPGVFYSLASVAGTGTQLVFSITAQGSMATLASFPGSQENIQSLPVSGSNGRFYSVVEHSLLRGHRVLRSLGAGQPADLRRAEFCSLLRPESAGRFASRRRRRGRRGLYHYMQPGRRRYIRLPVPRKPDPREPYDLRKRRELLRR